MADLTKLKRGPEHMVSSGGKGRFLPAIFWKENNESRYLAFVTSISQVPTLPIHFIQTANGWRDFVCRKAEIFEDENPDNECMICDTYKKKPDFKAVALAVELVPETERESGRLKVTGFEPLMDEYETEQDGKTETRQAPHVGVVKQARKNFWTPFVAEVEREQMRNGVGDLNEVVYEIVRVGGKDAKGGVSYKFYAYENRPDLTEYLDGFPTLEDWIEEKGSLAHYENELSGGVEEDDPDTSEPEREPAREKGDQSDSRSRFEELQAKLEERGEQEVEATA